VCASHPSILFFTSLLLFPESFPSRLKMFVWWCAHTSSTYFAQQWICEGFDPSSLLHVQ
jgi:hypothetical protein